MALILKMSKKTWQQSVTIQDADTSAGISGASLAIDAQAAVVADATGKLTVGVKSGQHSFKLAAAGYDDTQGTFTVDAAGNAVQP
jgi:hypothetical protein